MGGLRCFKTGWDARLFVHRGNLDLNNRAVLAFWTCPAVRPRPFRPSPSPFDIAAINLGHMRLPLSVSARGPAGAPRTHPKRSRRRDRKAPSRFRLPDRIRHFSTPRAHGFRRSGRSVASRLVLHFPIQLGPKQDHHD
jgi:hypothetical protein